MRNENRNEWPQRRGLDQGRIRTSRPSINRKLDERMDFGESDYMNEWDRDAPRSSYYQRDIRRSDYRPDDYGMGDYSLAADNRENGFSDAGFYDDTDFEAHRRSRRDGPHYGKGPKGWKRSDDSIRTDACEALMDDGHVDASEIEVSVEDGVIRLQGTVEERSAKRRAESCVENLSGVKDVINEIRLKRNTESFSSSPKQ